MPDAILLFGETYHHASLLYRTGFLCPDPVIYLEVEGRRVLFVSSLELGRARLQATVDEVRCFDDFDFPAVARSAKGPHDAYAAVMVGALKEAGVQRIRVEPEFPANLARILTETDIAVDAERPLFDDARRRKTPDEVDMIHRSQQAAESAMERARSILAAAENRDGALHWEGAPLTSKVLISAIEVELLKHGCGIEGTIAAGGAGAADPHMSDSGQLHADQPVIVDIFPQNKSNRYHGDLTRTFVPGKPTDTWLRMYAAVSEAHRRALAAVKAGVNGRDVHLESCRALYEAGFGTMVEGFRRDEGPIMNHGTGHGLGIEIHEPPRVSDVNVELLEGDVITIEPGLYHPDHGGVRIEDTIVVTADGYRNLTTFPTGWEL